MAYADLATIQATDPGDPLTAAWCDQARDNDEFFRDPPACVAFHNTTQALTNNVFAFLLANSETFDNDSMHSTVSNTGRLTIQTAGRYDITTTLEFAQPVLGPGNRFADFRVNGTTIHRCALVAAAAGNVTIVTGQRKLVLNAGDYVEVRAAHDSGDATLNVTLVEFAALLLTKT